MVLVLFVEDQLKYIHGVYLRCHLSKINAELAQLVEQRPCKAQVVRSIRTFGTITNLGLFMSLQIPKPEQLLQLGYDCGLHLVEEAYSCMMCHYDAFFLITDLKNQLKEFHANLVAAGIATVANESAVNFNDLTLEEAAKKINYAFTELPDLPPIPDSENFDFVSFDSIKGSEDDIVGPVDPELV